MSFEGFAFGVLLASPRIIPTQPSLPHGVTSDNNTRLAMASFALKASLATIRRAPTCPLRAANRSTHQTTRRALSVTPRAMAKEIIATDKV